MNEFNDNLFNNNEDTNNSADKPIDNGYTVTPEGGYYSKANSDIIQDDINIPNQSQNGYNTYSNNYQYNSYVDSQYAKPEKSQKPKREKRYGKGTIFISILLSVIISAVSSAFIIIYFSPEKTIVQEKIINSTGDNVNITVDETAQSTAEAVAKKAAQSVVGIRTTTSVMNFFGGSQEATGYGSGVIYTNDGYIITNYHVIADAISYSSNSKIEVYLDSLDSEPYLASVVGYNISSDLAVIKIKVNGLRAIEFSDSSKLQVGQYVITIGSPGGLEFIDSVTYGIISGLVRVVSSDTSVGLIQTDAAINPGNSGGALLNVKGELVGINSSKIASVEFEGMGFAIPANTVKEICDNIISRENEPEPYVGVSISEKYTSDVLAYYGFPSGAVVRSVAEDSPAHNAGIQRGDIITEFDGVKITEYHVFIDTLKQCKPGETVDIKIYRGGRYYTAKIKILSNS